MHLATGVATNRLLVRLVKDTALTVSAVGLPSALVVFAVLVLLAVLRVTITLVRTCIFALLMDLCLRSGAW